MRKRLVLGTAAIIALTLSGCTGGAPQTDSDPDSIRYLIGQPEDTADLDLVKEDLKAFEEETGISVKLDVVPSENMRTVLQTQLRSGEGPDVFGYDTGPGFAGALEKAGLLYDLTDAYAENDWPIYDFAQERVTFGGKLVGIPNDIESVGLFYNKTMFDDLGIEQPQTLDDLTAAAETIRDNDVIPFAVSDKEGWQGGHLLSMVLSSELGGDAIEELIAGDASWDSPEVVDALSVLADYNADEFFTPSATAVTYDNANALFYSGKAAINPTGSWLAQDIERNVDFEVGYMPFPASDSPGIFSGGLGSGLFISKSTSKADAAVQFLNWNVTEEHGKWQVENQQSIPAFPVDTTDIEASPLFTQILADAAKIADGTGDFGYNVDVLMSDTFNEAMWDGVQALLTGQKKPDQVAADLEKNY
ncbi:carbohydrate ABC transporter substrate-binding protein (CUT1 family) [Labedella gwakjiensis]|uniref:Carbohydrate ABC transporter substrate-binding protein (CUT1 family) n=1 Tax=Labedella gwakjiensis TaxID=390269 RepID=A0A2P8GU99_9MICO|nr:extracellular solute-binding protein [Labedella gwakjiensis]PSL37531.1 carbohydrate ABC transporter substrate-binding protein (CUT1 family) [Labedella gwakjiensis]RUQ84831.1 extracellular solute-binding protein [Labedella gwakjiensis]